MKLKCDVYLSGKINKWMVMECKSVIKKEKEKKYKGIEGRAIISVKFS